MSYCVNCGVELDVSAKKCALCSTPVFNPNVKDVKFEEKPFSDTVHIPKSVKKRFIAFVISMAMLIPNIVMLFLNIFFLRQNFWSLYVGTASFLIWVLFIFPFFMKKAKPYIMWAFDTFAVGFFFFTIFKLHGDNVQVLKLILSILWLLSVSVLISIIWLRHKKRHWTAFTVLILLLISVNSFIAGSLGTFFVNNYNLFLVGTVITVCSLTLMCFFIYCNRSKHIRAWLNKSFYI